MRIDQIIAILLCIIAIASIITYEWRSVKKRWRGQKVRLQFQFDDYKLLYCLGILSLTAAYVFPFNPTTVGMVVFGIALILLGKYGRKIYGEVNDPF